MIRTTLLWLFIGYLGIYAWKDWYKALCGLILLMAVVEHPDFPKSILGIQGLNPWNVLLFIVVMAWMAAREKENLQFDWPPYVNILLWLYFIVMSISTLRLLFDFSEIIEFAHIRNREIPTFFRLVSEHFINTYKWVVPSLLLFSGCRSRERLQWGLYSILGLNLLLAIQIIKWMPLSTVVHGVDLEGRSGKILQNEVGYHRVNLAQMMAGASWAFFAAREFVRGRRKMLLLLLSILVFFAMALTGGRTGYGTWAVIGAILCGIRWRKYLVIAPLLVILVFTVIPGAKERLMQGFFGDAVDINIELEREGVYETNRGFDLYTITAGRNIAWPYVIRKIAKAPFAGYGKEAMQRTGLAKYLLLEFGEGFPHPHNAYLQWILDNGFLGFIPIFIFCLLILHHSYVLFRDNRSKVFIAIGGISLSLFLALLVASMGSQTFYPREGSVGLWCGIALMLRVYEQRRKVDRKGLDIEKEENSLWIQR